AASASAPATPGSCSSTCSASRMCAITTAPGRSGAARCVCRSSPARSRVRCDGGPGGGRMEAMTSTLPAALAEIREEFLELPESDRLQLLLEYSGELPAIPAEYRDHPELCERVVECQSPVYIIVDVADDDTVAMHATAPPEAPTTRGFASILVQG